MFRQEEEDAIDKLQSKAGLTKFGLEKSYARKLMNKLALDGPMEVLVTFP